MCVALAAPVNNCLTIEKCLKLGEIPSQRSKLTDPKVIFKCSQKDLKEPVFLKHAHG